MQEFAELEGYVDAVTARLGAIPDRDETVEELRAHLESALLKPVLMRIWTAGGDPGTIMVGGFNKQAFSTFTGRSTPQEDAKSKKIVNSVDYYESDFGKQSVTQMVLLQIQKSFNFFWIR